MVDFVEKTTLRPIAPLNRILRPHPLGAAVAAAPAPRVTAPETDGPCAGPLLFLYLWLLFAADMGSELEIGRPNYHLFKVRKPIL